MINRSLAGRVRDFAEGFLRPEFLLAAPAVVERPSGSRILVLSPHFDDETFGCGGTLYKHTTAGEPVTVVHLTDGREGGLPNADKARLVEVRKAEAKNACSLLGIEDLIYLEQQDGDLRPTSALISALVRVFDSVRPDLVYLPSFLEAHVDHLEVSRIFLRLASEIGFRGDVCAYELTTPLVPNLIVDITAVMPRKEEAMRQYASQHEIVDYSGIFAGLNRYRSFALHGHGYAEAFLSASAADYLILLREVRIDRWRFLDRRLSSAARRWIDTVRSLKGG